MYGLVPYNISPIQQSIQYGHAVVEYLNDYFNDDECHDWRLHDKTFIILNGGTTNTRTSIEDGLPFGTLNNHALTLALNKVKLATFHEPDLGDQLTAVVFLVDERVYDKKTWPDYDGGLKLNGEPFDNDYAEWKANFSDDPAEADRIVFLREFLKQFRLA
jgi:hypothetical protein